MTIIRVSAGTSMSCPIGFEWGAISSIQSGPNLAINVGELNTPAEVVIGQISHAIAEGRTPNEIILVADSDEILSEYRSFLS